MTSIILAQRSMMRRSLLVVALGAIAAVGACSDSSAPIGELVYDYELQTLQDAGITLKQDTTFQLAVYLVRDGIDTVPAPRLTYVSDDYSIASVSSGGIVTAKKGGSTTIRAAFSGDTVAIPVTVTARPVTTIDLTINHTGLSTLTRYALPGDGRTVFLKAFVRAGTEIVYCNAIACADHATRRQRQVQFLSLDTTKATVANASGTVAQLNVRGQVTARDTSSEPVGIVLRVPSDSGVADIWADTVYLRFSLRPIDSLIIRPDSFVLAGTTTKVPYTSNVVADSSILLGVTLQNRTDSIISFQTTPGVGGKAVTTINVTRAIAPVVTWESANTNYAVVDNQGRVTGVRATWLPSTMAPPAPVPPNTLPPLPPAVATDIPACINQVFRTTGTDVAFWYDKVLTAFPIPSTGPWVVPTNGWRDPATPQTTAVTNDVMEVCATSSGVPATVARGVNCSTQIVGTAGAFCNVVIRATITDPANGAVRRAHFLVTVRNP
jgi:hypothetical protein